LHKGGVASETIDFLQAKTSSSILSIPYLAPPQDFKETVLAALHAKIIDKSTINGLYVNNRL
jgi:hypothetical protein